MRLVLKLAGRFKREQLTEQLAANVEEMMTQKKTNANTAKEENGENVEASDESGGDGLSRKQKKKLREKEKKKNAAALTSSSTATTGVSKDNGDSKNNANGGNAAAADADAAAVLPPSPPPPPPPSPPQWPADLEAVNRSVVMGLDPGAKDGALDSDGEMET